MPDPNHIVLLLFKQLKGELTESEAIELNEWKAKNDALYHELTNPETLQPEVMDFYQSRQNILNKIRESIRVRKIIPLWKKLSAAAAILIAISIGGYFLLTNNKTKTPTIAKVTDVEAPKSSKAMITLADGRTVTLDSISTGMLAEQDNVKLIKTAEGQITYSGSTQGQTVFNTLYNPRGSKVVNLTLGEGTTVWLNAGSSLTYPIAFPGNERKVTITGEAYFEVAHDLAKPFYVSKGDMQVQVLGTKFNVNAFDDEPDIKVTLLEGSVKVNKGTANILLKPGQQAQVTTEVKVINDVNLEQVMAWKNGRFEFGENTSLEDIMRQISRWYDVEIEYKEKIDQKFWGTVSRQENVSKVLEKFELTGRVHFKIEGNKITVSR